jgi:hypothetical protein
MEFKIIDVMLVQHLTILNERTDIFMLDKIINGFSVKIVGGQRQVRKHKKKRINKKWAKIYGYKYYSPLENGKTYIMDGAIYMNRWTYEYLLHCMYAVYGKTGELPICVGRR